MFNYEAPIEAMFYTNLTVYSELPNKTTISQLIANGNTVIVNNKNLPKDIMELPGIKIENLSKPY